MKVRMQDPNAKPPWKFFTITDEVDEKVTMSPVQIINSDNIPFAAEFDTVEKTVELYEKQLGCIRLK